MKTQLSFQSSTISFQSTKSGSYKQSDSFPSQNQPLKISNGVKSLKEAFNSPPIGKENISHGLKLAKGAKSDKGKVALKFEYGDKMLKVKQRSEKNYRDLNKSLANLVRVPGTSASGDEILPSKEFSVTANLGPQLEAYNKASNSGNYYGKRPQARTPQVSSIKNQYVVFHTEAGDLQDDYQFSQKIKIPQPEKTMQEKGKMGGFTFSRGAQRQLLTEGNEPIEMNNFGANLMRRLEEKPRLHTQQDSMKKMGPKLYGSGVKQFGMIGNCRTEEKENQEILNFNFISDGVQYGEGGVGVGRREKKQEGKSLLQEEKKKGFVEESKSTRKPGASQWKQELLEIQRDIEKRKQHYEQVNNFFTICNENGSFVSKPEENVSEYFSGAPIQRNLNFTSHQSQSQRYTMQTLHTLPNQTPNRMEQFTTPTYSSGKPMQINRTNSNQTEMNARWKQRNERLLADLKTNESCISKKMAREEQIKNDLGGRLKTFSHFENEACETREITTSFFAEHVVEKRVPKVKPGFCSDNGCQIF